MARAASFVIDDSAARRVAITLSKRLGLTPPVDAMEVLERYADIEHDDIPCGIDALLLDAHGRVGGRPLVVFRSSRKDSARERFTAAHELGHIVIPWQQGAVFCSSTGTSVLPGNGLETVEGDADAFASELLLPTEWLSTKLVQADSLAEFVADVRDDAGVSLHAVVRTGIRVMPERTSVLVWERDGRGVAFSYSRGHAGLAPKMPSDMTASELGRFSDAGVIVSQSESRGRPILVLQYPEEFSREVAERPSESSTSLLRRALEFCCPGDEHRSLFQTINGITGAANSSGAFASRDALYGGLRVRCLGRPSLVPLLDDPTFDRYLQARAWELWERRG